MGWDITDVNDGVNLNDDDLLWEATDGKDRDEGCNHTGTTLNEVAGEDSIVNKPFENQVFLTWEGAYEFYNAYAYATGFVLRKSSITISNLTKTVTSRTFVCNKEGEKKANEKRDDVKELRECRLDRMNCKARMIIKLRDKQWKVTTSDDINSHELTSLLPHLKRKCIVHIVSSVKIKAPAQIKNTINSTSNALVVSTNQVIAHLRAVRENNIGKEAVIVANHLQNRKSKDPNFYFELELDANGTLRSMFWADSKAREAYLTFSDVNIFDVTYKTNSFKLPFAPFTGVNHHRRSTLFGCAVLADETKETFTWLFEQWLTCMFGKAPGAIITDMDGAIRNAIRKNTSLVELLGQYDKSLVERRKIESEEDFKSKNTITKMNTTSPLERKAGEFYTKKMFTIFQDEMMGNFALWKDKLGKNGNVVEYNVGIRTDDKKKYLRVLFDSSNDVIATCQCAKFERK
ncbi:protein FAR1-RELATED SEQUENCE 5-like [Tasmannia lanceolata]|uniref:protein FAR1-RELATED SEQUENCE 5-like n=1 Tax=Tasmannia lanceolata TaxID=3420 RepID=UPI00406380F2